MLMREMKSAFLLYDDRHVWAVPEDDGPDSDVRWLLARVVKPFPCGGCGRMLRVDELVTPHEQSMQEWLALFERDKGEAARCLYAPEPDSSYPYCFDCYPVRIMRDVFEQSVRPGVVARAYVPLPPAYEPGGSEYAGDVVHLVRPGRSRGPSRQPRRGPVPSRRGRFRPHS